MPTTTLSPAPWLQFEDINGRPYAGGRLYTYVAGSEVPATVYQDPNGSIPHSNPIILDAAGEAEVWLPPTGSFKYVLKDSSDVLVKSRDNISSVALSAELSDALDHLRDGMIFFGGSDAAAFMGVSVPVGTTKTARAPGTGIFTLDEEITADFEATLWVETAGTATVAIYPIGASETPVVGSTLTTTDANGARVATSSPITLVAGTYIVKGHSAHATKQAWGVGYRVVPTA